MGSGPWLGLRRVAFVPVDRPGYNEPNAPPPANWADLIWQRVFYWADRNGLDVSLRNYIVTTSYGRADIEGEVQPMETVNIQDVPPSFLAGKLEQSLRDQGFDAAALVMLGGACAGQGDPGGFWARFVMAEGVGVWAMELTHVLVNFVDLYSDIVVPRDLKPYDNMAGANGVHCTAYSKTLLGWLDPSAIVEVTGSSASYDLYALGLVQPPAPGRVTAIKADGGGRTVFAEARLRVDQYDGGNQWNAVGIPGEGVIVYEQVGVENPYPSPGEIDPLIALLTPTALAPGQSVTSDTGISVSVTAQLDGGYRIAVTNPYGTVSVPDLHQKSATLATEALAAVGLVRRLHRTLRAARGLGARPIPGRGNAGSAWQHGHCTLLDSAAPVVAPPREQPPLEPLVRGGGLPARRCRHRCRRSAQPSRSGNRHLGRNIARACALRPRIAAPADGADRSGARATSVRPRALFVAESGMPPNEGGPDRS